MTAVDTNLLVRLLTRDDEAQYQKAVAAFGGVEVLIPATVWLETEWVLRYAYGFDVARIAMTFRNVLGLPNVHTPEAGRILTALEWHQQGLDFADALHLASSQDAEVFLTFDQEFVRKANTFGRCHVTQPK